MPPCGAYYHLSGINPAFAKLIQLLVALGVNAIPAFGWFFADWTSGTTLAVYWFENLAASVIMAARICVHQRLSPRQGHFRYEALNDKSTGPRRSYLAYFSLMAMTFTIAHGIFLAAFIFILSHNGRQDLVKLNVPEMISASGFILLILSVSFLADLVSLKNRSFEWLESMGNRTIGRVMVVHLTLVLGLFAVAITGATKALFAVFITFKTLADLSFVFPQWSPKEAPAWLCRIMDKVPSVQKPGLKFADFWKQEDAAAAARLIKNEKPLKD